MIKISTTSLRGEVKPSVPCCKILQHVEDPYSMTHLKPSSQTFLAKFLLFHYQVSLLVTARALVGELEIIITQMGKDNRSVMAAVYGTPYVIPPCKQ
jgi:hypothetical protein